MNNPRKKSLFWRYLGKIWHKVRTNLPNKYQQLMSSCSIFKLTENLNMENRLKQWKKHKTKIQIINYQKTKNKLRLFLIKLKNSLRSYTKFKLLRETQIIILIQTLNLQLAQYSHRIMMNNKLKRFWNL